MALAIASSWSSVMSASLPTSATPFEPTIHCSSSSPDAGSRRSTPGLLPIGTARRSGPPPIWVAAPNAW